MPVIYVRNLEASRAFYALFGYEERQSGGDADANWAYLQHGEHTMLVAATQPPLIQVELPLLIYLYVTELGDIRRRLEEAGHECQLSGYPDHAPGGELRVKDPDGNGVLVGQRTAVPRPSGAEPAEPARSSLLQQAAEAVARRGGAPATCQIRSVDGEPCDRPAELKLADSWGITVWGCLVHADEALINAPGAFLATEDAQGLGPWLSRRQRDQ